MSVKNSNSLTNHIHETPPFAPYDDKLGKWIIDTDPGVDDSFAILFAMNYLKKNLIALSIEGGNTGIEQCFLNAKKICSISGLHIPIYKGCVKNITAKTFTAEDIHGNDGLFDLENFAKFEEQFDTEVYKQILNEDHPFLDQCSALKIIELCYKYDDVNILAIGPLTNLATAFMIEPDLVNRIKKLVVMGGSYLSLGNIVPAVEFNFACDPIATKIVFDNFKNIIVYPWEPCLTHLLLEEELNACIHDNHRSNFCKEILIKKINSFESGCFPDYGGAISGFAPFAIKKSKKVEVDIIVDSTSEINGAMILGINGNKEIKERRNKVEIVEQLHMNLFKEFFAHMIK